jgi:hypothetical protein
MAVSGSQLSALPIAVHGQAVTRLSQAELVHFETMLATTDDTLEACMEARETSERWPEEEGSSRAVLQAMTNAICALTGVAPPSKLHTKRDAVAWVHRTMLDWRDLEVGNATKRRRTMGMDPAVLVECMKLVSKLNSTIGDDPGSYT